MSSHLRSHLAAPSTCHAPILRARQTYHLRPQPTSAGGPRGREPNAQCKQVCANGDPIFCLRTKKNCKRVFNLP